MTCRARKVRCDKQKPVCDPCNRLNYFCDWQLRITFENETSKILGRMTEVSSEGSLVWNPPYESLASAQSNQGTGVDTLPPFAELLTDKQREQKASYHQPGTFNVIANPETFQRLPEYRSRGLSLTSLDAQGPSTVDQYHSIGQDYIILAKFEEFPYSHSHEDTHSRTASPPRAIFPSPPRAIFPSPPSAIFPSPPSAIIPSGQFVFLDGDRYAHLLEHYRNVLAKQLCWLTDKRPGPDVFETYAMNYFPLYLAIVALSSLSLSRHNNESFADSLEHYQKVIPALQIAAQRPKDTYSDGALFTHYLLLLFEVAATEQRKINMWEHHSSQILRILRLRKQSFGEEPHSFIIAWATSLDMYALLTTTGTGSFSKTIIEENLLPSPEQALKDEKLYMVFDPEALRQMPDLLRANRELTLIAIKMAQMARELRAEARDLLKPRLEINMHQCNYIRDAHTLLVGFHDTWRSILEFTTPEKTWIGELAQLPDGVFTCRTHVSFPWIMQKKIH
ncbi:hypothetical protein OCU04_000090 [Sclerotinia nivalis]|uniref:Zn(2)-C6 fungal-type domain-containing protein n=1 Tax=Sclerotinia nivalis TaxID=352851 RepID=A0A9X0AYT2_9HELO|nr:hypothetical protein OCU04_000090 [Sclerotinia nivalis]